MASDEEFHRLQEQVRALQTENTNLQHKRLQAEMASGYFEGLLESAPDGIVIVDAQARIVLVNGQTELMSGYSRAELLGHLVEVLIPPRYGEIHIQHRNGFLAEPRTRPMGIGLDLYLQRKDGQEVPVEISLSPFQTPTGLLVIASIRDITTRKEAQQEIKRLNADLQRHVEQLNITNKELEAFSYSVSHDLRAPLRGIDGFSKVLMEDYPDRLDERGRDYLGRVRHAAQRMNQLIEDILNLSRIGRAEMRALPVNLSELAASVVYELQSREPDRQVHVEILPDATANGDQNLLRIVLENLLGNAWKFTSNCAAAEIVFGMTEREQERVFFVRDNGAGFDMTYADKLFTPFQRLHTTEEFPGSGIGLAIVQRIVTRHGGHVWAESVEGQGSTFYFSLPTADNLPFSGAP